MKKRVHEEIPDDLPDDLPEAECEAKLTALDASRNCMKCGQEARIVSNHLGVRAYCGPCKIDWPVSGPLATPMPLSLPRGITKQTMIPPDTQLAYEDLEWDEEYKRSK